MKSQRTYSIEIFLKRLPLSEQIVLRAYFTENSLAENVSLKTAR